MKRKVLITTALTLGLGLSSIFTSFAATWKQDTIGYWYQEDNGNYPANQWKKIEDKWYYFNASGYMVSNAWVGNYYVGSDGIMLTNTTTPDGYKVGADGAWIQDGYISVKEDVFKYRGFNKEDLVNEFGEVNKDWYDDLEAFNIAHYGSSADWGDTEHLIFYSTDLEFEGNFAFIGVESLVNRISSKNPQNFFNYSGVLTKDMIMNSPGFTVTYIGEKTNNYFGGVNVIDISFDYGDYSYRAYYRISDGVITYVSCYL